MEKYTKETIEKFFSQPIVLTDIELDGSNQLNSIQESAHYRENYPVIRSSSLSSSVLARTIFDLGFNVFILLNPENKKEALLVCTEYLDDQLSVPKNLLDITWDTTIFRESTCRQIPEIVAGLKEGVDPETGFVSKHWDSDEYLSHGDHYTLEYHAENNPTLHLDPIGYTSDDSDAPYTVSYGETTQDIHLRGVIATQAEFLPVLFEKIDSVKEKMMSIAMSLPSKKDGAAEENDSGNRFGM